MGTRQKWPGICAPLIPWRQGRKARRPARSSAASDLSRVTMRVEKFWLDTDWNGVVPNQSDWDFD
jgi:hypothetical protein